VVDRDAADCAAVTGGLPVLGHAGYAADLSDLAVFERLPGVAEDRLGS
jgi:hypothetical protein